MGKLEVFVSHVTIEAEFAHLVTTLIGRDFIGLTHFFVSSDATSIPVGEQWFDRLLSALQAADLQFVVCSPESVRRPWINYEAGGEINVVFERLESYLQIEPCKSIVLVCTRAVPLAIIGTEPTDQDTVARVVIHGAAATVLPSAARRLQA